VQEEYQHHISKRVSIKKAPKGAFLLSFVFIILLLIIPIELNI
jgi:hypothetical protein